MFVRNGWEIYTSSPPNKDGKMVHFGFCAVSSTICGGGGLLFFMILSKIVAPWGLPIIWWSFGLKKPCQDQQTKYLKIIDNACGINFCFSKVSYSVRRTFNQPTETSFLLLDFSFRKDLVHYVAQILLFPVTPELFRHSAADITLPGLVEHHPTLGQKWVTHSPSRSEQVPWWKETAIASCIYPKHLHFLKDKYYI